MLAKDGETVDLGMVADLARSFGCELGAEEVQADVASMDEDGEGLVTQGEFEAWWAEHEEARRRLFECASSASAAALSESAGRVRELEKELRALRSEVRAVEEVPAETPGPERIVEKIVEKIVEVPVEMPGLKQPIDEALVDHTSVAPGSADALSRTVFLAPASAEVSPRLCCISSSSALDRQRQEAIDLCESPVVVEAAVRERTRTEPDLMVTSR
eukprot:COSAG01_NODE_24073_length_791_cov_1.864162_1_plen_215_part_01